MKDVCFHNAIVDSCRHCGWLQTLDPGIKVIVNHLLAAGLETTDSGDGWSKGASEDVLPYAHVFCQTTRDRMFEECDKAATLMYDLDSDAFVQASYCPLDEDPDNTCVIAITWQGPLGKD